MTKGFRTRVSAIFLVCILLLAGTCSGVFAADTSSGSGISEERMNQIVSGVSFEEAEFTPNGDGVDDVVNGTFTLTEQARVDVWITNAAKVHVKKVVDYQELQAGTHSFQWDGKSFGEGKSPDGPYWAKVIVYQNGIYGDLILPDAKIIVKDSYQIVVPQPVQKVRVTSPTVKMTVEPYHQGYTASQGDVFPIIETDTTNGMEYMVLVNGSVVGRISVTDVEIIELETFPEKWGTILRDGVNALSGPGTDYQVLETLSKGKNLRILRHDAAWYRVLLDSGKQAFVRVSDLETQNTDVLVSNVQVSNTVITPRYKVVEPLTKISFNLARKSAVSIWLKNGYDTIYLLNESLDPALPSFGPGTVSVEWNGRNKYGYAVHDGTYKLYIATTDLERNTTNVWENPSWDITVEGVGQWPLPEWRMKEIVTGAEVSSAELVPNVAGKDKVEIKVRVAEKADIQVGVVYPDDIPTTVMHFDKSVSEPGEYTFTWDGKTWGGSIASDETYYLRVYIKEPGGDWGYLKFEEAQIRVKRQVDTPTDPPAPIPDGDGEGVPGGDPGDIPGPPDEVPPLPGETPGTPGETPETPGETPETPGESPETPGETPGTPGEKPNPGGNNGQTPGGNNGPKVVYIVCPGDTLYKIAKKYGTTVDEIVKANNLDPDKYLMVGQKLIIPVKDKNPVKGCKKSDSIVRQGNILWKIALKIKAGLLKGKPLFILKTRYLMF